ncbi:hypothetical protein GM658_20220 [Pseudoduganella eburnea]|uniref:DUF1440 domain-containing protein n=1 Tax=Massilia eburnea TaxID=1776165 RepID=A0A6L6QLY7_9BURK|nr:hypothetical protein [Massilia eburnea]MTW12937.1 hypothetical protein [Massilia eburnea]
MTRAILTGGALGGLLDILFAMSFAALRGTPPERLLQVVASGALGQAAFTGGTTAAAIGLACHFALSFMWMAAFFVAARRMPALAASPMLAAAGYGLLVFFIMRLVVLPLSAFPRPVTFNAFSWGMDILSHIFLFSLPIVWATRKALPAS